MGVTHTTEDLTSMIEGEDSLLRKVKGVYLRKGAVGVVGKER